MHIKENAMKDDAPAPAPRQTRSTCTYFAVGGVVSIESMGDQIPGGGSRWTGTG